MTGEMDAPAGAFAIMLTELVGRRKIPASQPVVDTG